MNPRDFVIHEGVKTGFCNTGHDGIFFSQPSTPYKPETTHTGLVSDGDLWDQVQSAPATPKGGNRYPEHDIYWKAYLERHIIYK